jgi:hypothetical protein
VIEKYEKETTTKYVICKESKDFKNLSKLVKMNPSLTEETKSGRGHFDFIF